MRTTLVAVSRACLAAATPSQAVPVIDGTRDAEHGAAKPAQTVQTQFGDNMSELNAAYAACDGGRLNLMVTGNIEDNVNNIEIFIDSKAGGRSVFDSSGNNVTENMDGLAFDAGFTADYHLHARRGRGWC